MIDIQGFISYLNNQPFSDKTKEAYLFSIKHYQKYFSEVSTENLNKYKSICLNLNKPNTINLRLHALQHYAIFQNIKVDIKYIKTQSSLFSENILTRAEYNKILVYLLLKKQYDWYLIFRVMACTGVRINESKQITYGDLKTYRKTIIGKGTKTRVIWFPKKMRKEIAPYLRNHKDSEFLMTHDDSYVRVKMKELKKKLNLKGKLTPHELRRFYAREVYNKTKDIYLVKDLLGHASIKTTMEYLKISVNGVSKRMGKIVDW